ncbi:flagellar biosynthetic protein FliO [Cellulomonas sp. NPDC089187]|uniref:FliO/MopB family protein n=1 Tax=Cellulomonas sp. NPDC089187 TaxID=3154970 RepID=UPI003422411C
MDTLVLAGRTLLALACVVGLIWVVARRAGWGKSGRKATGPAIAVVGRQALGRHAGVAVLAVGERRLLVGYGEQQVTMLSELDAMEPVDSAPAPATPASSRHSGAEPESTPPVPNPATAAALAAANSALANAARLVPAGDRAGTPNRSVPAVPTQPSPGAHTTVPGLAGARVSDIDPADLTPAPEPAVVNGNALDGSILAPSTWRQAVSALRERTVRR